MVQAQGALRDLRYFFLTNNLRFVKTFLQMRIEAVLLKICKIRNHQNYAIYHLICINLHRILQFLYLRVIVQAQGALRDRRYFFLTNNLRFVKTFLQMRIEAVLLKICKIRNHQNYAIYYLICINLYRILQFFVFMCYSTSTRSSAGSQIFFLDKQFEICQKFSADENQSFPSQNMQNHKSSKIMLYITSFVSIYTEYCNFLYLRVIVQAQGALRDLRYFFSTNNLRFVKTFLQMRIEAVLLQT